MRYWKVLEFISTCLWRKILPYTTIYIYIYIYKINSWTQAVIKNMFSLIKCLFVRTIGSFFQLKERIPCDLRSCLVYNCQCSGCNSQYIGSTTRSFRARRLEHMGLSILTTRPISRPEYSQIRYHSEETAYVLLFI